MNRIVTACGGCRCSAFACAVHTRARDHLKTYFCFIFRRHLQALCRTGSGILCYVVLYYVTSYHDISCHDMQYGIIEYNTLSSQVMHYHIKHLDIIPCFLYSFLSYSI